MPNAAVTAINRRAAAWSPAIKTILYWGGLIPAAWTFYLGVNDQLGADPMRTLEQTLGLWALRFLIAALVVSPFAEFAGINLFRFRRALGLLCFFYASMHLATYVILDRGLAWDAIWADILKRPYITIGVAAFVILAPLAATSHNAMIRLLGPANWQRLHRFIYLAAILAVAHFVLLVKSWPLEPLIYAAIVVALLLHRLMRSLRRRPAAA